MAEEGASPRTDRGHRGQGGSKVATALQTLRLSSRGCWLGSHKSQIKLLGWSSVGRVHTLEIVPKANIADGVHGHPLDPVLSHRHAATIWATKHDANQCGAKVQRYRCWMWIGPARPTGQWRAKTLHPKLLLSPPGAWRRAEQRSAPGCQLPLASAVPGTQGPEPAIDGMLASCFAGTITESAEAGGLRRLDLGLRNL